MNIQDVKNPNNTIRMMASILIGNILIALAVSAFVSGSGIIMGGSTGISLIVTHYFPQIPLAAAVFLIDLVLFLAGTLFLGKKFAVNTIASTIIYPLSLQIFQQVPLLIHMTEDITLCSVLGGFLLGLGIGLIDRTGGSSGGTDSIALIINKYTHISLGVLIYIIDGSVLLLQAVFSNTDQILYGIIFLIVQTLVLNRAMIAGKVQIQLTIISDRHEEIRRNLLSVQDVGATMFPIEKGFTSNKSSGIICIVPRKKLYDITDMINSVDPMAFITIHEVNEVRGGGFTRARIKYTDPSLKY